LIQPLPLQKQTAPSVYTGGAVCCGKYRDERSVKPRCNRL
jgi:hypothetical protein